jgi:hypothetical protein
MVPAPLLFPFGMEFSKRRPYPEMTIGNRQPAKPETTTFQVSNNAAPGFLALTISAVAGKEYLLAIGERSNNHQKRRLFFLKPGFYIYPICPLIDHLKRGEVLTLPLFILKLPFRLQPLYRRGRQGCPLSQQAPKSHFKISLGQTV